MRAGTLLALTLGLGLLACSDDAGEMNGTPDAAAHPDAAPVAQLPYATLSQYGFFKGTGSTQEPNAGVVPYDVNSSLFADFADKHRFIVVPPGGKIGYAADDKWQFPVGTMIVKSFGYGQKLVETRVLILRDAGWLPTTYLWTDDQTDANLNLFGAIVPVTYTDEDGQMKPLQYQVPNQNQCYGCHLQPGVTNVIGLRTRQLNRTFDYGHGAENQIDHMAALGLFASAPPPAADRAALPDPFGDAPIEARARAWLESNCSHCHQPGGAANSTNLYLFTTVTTPLDFGVCRYPNAAGAGAGGHTFDVVPGHPEDSVMAYRIASTEPGVKMPEMPIQLVDQHAVDLISAWIAGLPGSCPNPK